MTGHLFAIQGDMTRLDSDAVVIPCDEAVNLNPVWRPFPPSEDVTHGPHGWVRLRSVTLEEGHASVGVVNGVHVRLVATAAEKTALTVGELTRRVAEAVQRAGSAASRHRGRHLPLITLPLVGTGYGGLRTQRSYVVRSLVQALTELAGRYAVDIALVLHDRRDYAAVQAARGAIESGHKGTCMWSGLTPGQVKQADDLGRMAAKGELSLFVGSGVSVPLGLPNWHQLMQRMAHRFRPEYEVPKDADLLHEAAGFKWLMGDDYVPFMRELFEVPNHALGHALLAGLNIRQMVTTNYDPALELALEGIHGRRFEVLTRSHATGGRPWLLKLHGDIRDPRTLVLTEAEYQRLAQEGGALHGVVESLMLTSHLLFVGYSLEDHDFADVAEGVKRVRDQALAVDASSRRSAGTALALHPNSVNVEQWRGEVDVIGMSEDGDSPLAARLLEVFLDRVAWAALQTGELAAEYLLDERYAAGASTADTALRDAVVTFLQGLPPHATASAGWPKVAALLESLGADPASLPSRASRGSRVTGRKV